MKIENDWWETGEEPTIGKLDWRVITPVPLVLFHIAWSTAALTLVVLLLFWWLHRRNYTLDVLLRILRLSLGGWTMPIRVRGRYEQWNTFRRNSALDGIRHLSQEAEPTQTQSPKTQRKTR